MSETVSFVQIVTAVSQQGVLLYGLGSPTGAKSHIRHWATVRDAAVQQAL